MRIQQIKCGNGNCYILEDNGNAILVDTCKEQYREEILRRCKEVNLRLIILTHTHIDHCQNASYLSKELNVPIAIHRSDEELITDNSKQHLSAHTLLGKLVLALSKNTFNEKIPTFQPTYYLKEGDSLSDLGINGTIMELPGHTNGSIGINLGKDGVIVGDALMNMFYPTVSMLYHNRDQMMDSVKKISGLGGTMIYFGHGKPKKNWLRV